MKKLLPLAAIGLLAGCMSPNWTRVIPENKDFDGEINTIYGHMVIHSRVNPAGTNPLPPLPVPGTSTIVVQPAPMLPTPSTRPLPGNPDVLPR